MKLFFLLSLLSFYGLGPALLFAEGIPKNEDGSLAVPHLKVSLNESQREETSVLNSVTLTKEQWQTVRQKSPNTPKRIEGLLSITHNDCTCGESYGAVLLSQDEIAIFLLEQTPEILVMNMEYEKCLNFRVDERGQFYHEGVLTRYSNLIAALEKAPVAPTRPAEELEKLSDADWYQFGIAYIDVPHLMPSESPVYAERVKEVSHLLAARGWKVLGRAPFTLLDAH